MNIRKSIKNYTPERQRVILFNEYWAFVQWMAMPAPLREPKSQKELARELSVHYTTLTVWKSVEGFWDDARAVLRLWCKEKTPNVIASLYTRIMKTGSAAEVKLWLQLVESLDILPDATVEEKKPDTLVDLLRASMKNKEEKN